MGCAERQSNLVKDNEIVKKDMFLALDPQGHIARIDDIIVTKDQNLISGSNDKTIRVWDKKGNTIRKILGEAQAGHEGKIYTLALSPDEKYLAVGGYFPEHVIRIYDYKTGKLFKILKSHTDVTFSLSFSKDGKYLVSASGDKTAKIWNAYDNFSLNNTIKSEYYPFHNTSFISKNNKNIVVLALGQVVTWLYDIENKKIVKIYESKYNSATAKEAVRALAVSEKHIAMARNEHDIDIFDTDLNLIKTITTKDRPTSLSYSSDGAYLAASDVNKYDINIYDVKKNYEVKKTFSQHTNVVMSVKFVNQNTVVSGGGNKHELFLWDFNTGKIIQEFSNMNASIQSIGINKNIIAWGTKYQSPDASVVFEKSINLENFQIQNVISQDFKQISTRKNRYVLKAVDHYIGDRKYLAIFWSHDMTTPKQYMDSHNSNYNCYGWYGDYIIAGGHFGRLTVYDTSGAIVTNLVGHTGDVLSIAVEGERLVSVANDGSIKIWNLHQLSKEKVIYPSLTLFVDKNNEYIAYTEEGYFLSSQNSTQYIGYHLNKGYDKEAEWISIDKLYDYFFRPDLVKLKLKGEDISKYTNGITYKEVLQNLPPTVSIASINGTAINSSDKKTSLTTPMAKVSFSVTENNGGSGLIRIYQEGKLVKTIGSGQVNRQSADVDIKTEEAKIDKKSKEAQNIYLAKLEDTVTKSLGREFNTNELVENVTLDNGSAISTKGTHTIELPLKAGNNTISIEAFNKTNTVVSYRDSVNINASIKPKEPKIYAIALGVNEFEQSSVSPLKYSENDANEIAAKIRQATSFQTDVTLLTGVNMTKENIQKALQNIKAKAGLEDKVIFYVSTHGKAVNGNLFLVPQNNKSVKNWINFEEIFKEVQSISALDQIFVIDACESGKASDIMASVYDAKASVLAKQSGVHVLMATTKGTYAFEHPDKNVQHGVFTYNILKALEDPKTDKNGDKWISIVELSKTLQEPSNNMEQQFPIIRNVGQDTHIKQLSK